MSRLCVLAVVALVAACTSLPPHRYAVRRFDLRGVRAMDEDALRSCLSTTRRDPARIELGAADVACGEPPFDERRPRLGLWTWPGTAWPVWERLAFEEDLLRIERWYAARGHHAARVVEARVVPERAQTTERCEGDACIVDLTVRIDEGPATRVFAVHVRGTEALPPELRRRVRAAVLLRPGDRFDEALYEKSKAAIADLLADRGHALARVQGGVRLDRVRRRATIELSVAAGPRCRFGRVLVEGTREWASFVRRVAAIPRGAPYRKSELVDAHGAIYALGTFSIVIVEPVLPEGDLPEGTAIDVKIRVVRGQRVRFGVGLGLQSGVMGAAQGIEQTSVPEWDLHLLARYQHKGVLGGLGQLTVEERPRAIVPSSFPGVDWPSFGNVLHAQLRQPGLVEARTWGVMSAAHEYGPDPFADFHRHRVDTGVAVERAFLPGRTRLGIPDSGPLWVSIGLRNSVSVVPPSEATESSVVTFWEQRVRLDLRDVAARPHGGASLELTANEAGFGLPSSWSYVRLLPDARVYVPFPWRITLALRVALGLLFVERADADLDPLSAALGPRDFRLRGGGASSNRGFLPGRLGDGPEGGRRRWESSLELRVPFSASFGTVLFADAGDVHDGVTFRLDHPQLSLGFGLRWFSPLGALAIDLGWRVPGMQVLGEDRRDPGGRETAVSIAGWRFPGAAHFSLGEAF